MGVAVQRPSFLVGRPSVAGEEAAGGPGWGRTGIRGCHWQGGGRHARISCVPRKLRQLISDLEQAGFLLVSGGKGSHRKFRHPRFSGSLILSGQSGDDAKHYQERMVRNAIRETTQ